MFWKDANVLITEARKLGYRGTDWEQSFIAQLELLQPATLTDAQAKSVTEFYRRAAGGRQIQRRQFIGPKSRFIPEDDI